MKHLALITAFAVFFIAHLHAATPSHTAAVEKLFAALNMEKQYEEGLLAGFDATSKMPPEQLAQLGTAQKQQLEKRIALVRKKLLEMNGWSSVKPLMVDLYARNFSEKEIADILKLSKDPAFQILIKKQTAIVREALEIGHKQGQKTLPKIMEAVAAEEIAAESTSAPQ